MKVTGRSAVVGAFVLVAVAPPGCGGEGFSPGVPRTINQTFNIHAAGDTVSLAGGLITIIVPPGAISEDGNVTATALSADSVAASPLLVRNSAYEISVSPATLQVLDSIEVQVNYAALTLPTGVRGPELRINKVVSSAWQPIPGGTNDSAASTVAAAVTSFSVFGILGLPVASLVVSPTTISVAAEATQPITASPKDSLGNTLSNRAVSYASSDVTKATVSAAGVVTGIAAGTATITIASETKSAQIPTTVTPGSASTSQSSVSVSASSVASGETVTLTLQAKDANGTNLTTGGLSVEFTATGGTSTSTIGATTDNANGTYTATFTGVTAGTATTIGAMIGGVAVTSTLPTLVVTSPGSGPDPNEPIGFTRFANRAFNSATCDANDNLDADSTFNGAFGWGLCATVVRSGNWSIVADSTGPVSPPNVGQIRYPAGFPSNGIEPINTANHFLVISSPRTSFNPAQVYVHLRVRLSPNFQGHSSGVNKILFWKRGAVKDPVVTLVAFGSGSGALEFMMRAQGVSRAGGASLNLAANLGTPADNAITRGVWTDVEVLVQTNTSGNFDGVVDVWVRGVHTAHYADIQWYTPGNDSWWYGVFVSPIWGGSGGPTVTNDMYLWLDHLYVSGRP